jgi:hypothetical protein
MENFWPKTQAIQRLLENIVRKLTTPLAILCCFIFPLITLSSGTGRSGEISSSHQMNSDDTPSTIQFPLLLNAPTAPGVALLNDTGGSCTPGVHSFKVTFLTETGETSASPASGTVTCDALHTKVVLQVPTASSNLAGRNPVATGRNIYATKAGGSTYYLIAQAPVINGNLEDTYGVLYTTYTFNLPDSSLTTTVAPITNTAVFPAITIDNFGNVGIGTTRPVFVDDLQAKTLAVDGGKNGYAYIGIGADTQDPNARVGALNFYNWGEGGVDHRTSAIMSFNDGALGKGNLKFFTSPNIVGPNQVGMIDSNGAWSLGGHNSNSNTRLYLETFSTAPVGNDYLLMGAQRGSVGLFVFNDKGWLSINNANSRAPSPFSVGANADFSIDSSGRISKYANVVPTNGQLLIGKATTGTFEPATLIAGSGVTIANGPGSIVISATGGAGGGTGNVSGPSSSAVGSIPMFADGTGKVLQDSGRTLPSGQIIGTTDTQALTNKSLSGTSNTFTNIPLATAVTGILPAVNGGTGSSFTAFTGPTLSTKTFALPNQSATILTTNAAVTAPQGGTGQSSYVKGDLLVATNTAALSRVPVGANGQVLTADPTQPSGVKWATPDSSPGGTIGEGTNYAVQAWNTGSQIIPSAVMTVVALNSTTADSTQDQHSNTTNNTRLVCRSAGTYVIHAEVEWFAAAGGVRRLYIKSNGSTTIALSKGYSANSYESFQNQVTAFWTCTNPGEYVEMYAFQNSGGQLVVSGGLDGVGGEGANTSPRLSWWKVN